MVAAGGVRTTAAPITEAIIPAPAMAIGSTARLALNSVALDPATPAMPTVVARASEAMIDPTYDSNRSAPMPATSPTLSPTLSAITAGLRGSSSGSPASTFPTRSAPTSAAFV